jgi:Na+-transporting methylmalonyl-CoA/oxaloacetate decarboxylase gamma subunit
MLLPFCAVSEPTIPQVILLGMGTVFVGIAAIIVICLLISLISRGRREEPSKAIKEEEQEQISGELAAVIGAAVAGELGADVSAIKIVSVKKVKG